MQRWGSAHIWCVLFFSSSNSPRHRHGKTDSYAPSHSCIMNLNHFASPCRPIVDIGLGGRGVSQTTNTTTTTPPSSASSSLEEAPRFFFVYISGPACSRSALTRVPGARNTFFVRAEGTDLDRGKMRDCRLGIITARPVSFDT
ncbi:hypothetical protein C8Q73DRAFT_19191 [Cubamyces lactineus]|nr:hypothetical protein C8Q73DRAFT_19191 [Cubamyces lactineus]